MKFHISILFTLLTTCNLYSQFTVPCHYITQTNDTVKGQIKIVKSTYGQLTASDYFDKITIIDSINGDREFKPSDIKSYKFQFNGKGYEFYSKPISTKGIENSKNLLNKFVPPLVIGTKTCLYEYFSIKKDTNGISHSNSVFIFEKPDGVYRILSQTSTPDEYKKMLRTFYIDNQKAQWLIDELLHSHYYLRNDIIEIVKAVNNS